MDLDLVYTDDVVGIFIIIFILSIILFVLWCLERRKRGKKENDV